MGRFILAILAFGAALAVIKMVIVALVIAGLIFRTRVTIGLLLIGGWLTLTAANPVVGLGLAAALIVVAVKKANKGAKHD